MAVEGNALVSPVCGKRLDVGRYECEFGNEIPIRPTGGQMDLIIISQQFHDVLESRLRETPEQGF